MIAAPPRTAPTSISSANAPALDLPARFMALAMTALALVAVLLPWGLPLLFGGVGASRQLAFVHLNTLGVVGALIVGASYQLVPVVLQTPLASVRLGRVSFWGYLAGLTLFLVGLLTTREALLAPGAALLFSTLLLYAALIAWTLRRSPHRDVVAWHIAASLIGLCGGVTLGLLLALNETTGFLGDMTLRLLAGHVTLMLGGWIALLLAGVSYRLAGMFTLSEDRLWSRVAWAELLLSAGGAWGLALSLATGAGRIVLFVAALLLVAGQALFAIQMVHLYRVRRRRGFDVHIPFVLVAALAGVAAAALLAGEIGAGVGAGSRLWTAVVWLALAGLAESAIQGFFYKIATFLVWLHRYAPLAGRQRVPRLEALYSQQLAKAGWLCWTAGLTLSVVAILVERESIGRLAGLVIAAGLAAFLINVARIATHWKPIGRKESQYERQDRADDHPRRARDHAA